MDDPPMVSTFRDLRLIANKAQASSLELLKWVPSRLARAGQGFLDLPREIGDLIYGLALVVDYDLRADSHLVGLINRRRNLVGKLTMHLLRACRQIYAEAMPVFCRENRFTFTNSLFQVSLLFSDT